MPFLYLYESQSFVFFWKLYFSGGLAIYTWEPLKNKFSLWILSLKSHWSIQDPEGKDNPKSLEANRDSGPGGNQNLDAESVRSKKSEKVDQ